MNEIKVLDLFTGVGGFSLGLERAGPFRTVAFCEQDPYCQAVLRKHWPDVPIYDDVKTFDYAGECDLITGGYPCQPFSVAGKQKGTADDRHLWPFMFEIIKQKRPAWVICENVAGHITMGLDEVLFDLESEGYTSRPFVIPACAVDAPHRRDRVWIVAHADGAGLKQGDKKMSARSSEQFNGGGFQFQKNVSDAHGKGLERRLHHKSLNAKRRQVTGDRQLGKCGDGQCRSGEILWATEPDVGRVAHGVPRRVDRIKALGNAVVPQVVTQIGKAIIEAER